MTKDESRKRRLSQILREYREARGLTQGAVAEAIGVSRMTYHRIENGAGLPKKPQLEAICTTIGVEPDALLREAGYTAIPEE